MLFRHCCSYRQFFHELCFKTIKAPLLCPFFRKHSLDNSSFLKEISSLSHSIVFPMSVDCSLKKASLSLLAVLWNSASSWVYVSLPPLTFLSLLSSAICKASSDNHLAFLHFFFFGMVWSLPPVQFYEPLFIVLQALFLPDLIPSIYLSLPLIIIRDLI